MVQPPWTTGLPSLTGAIAVCLLFSGCAAFQVDSIGDSRPAPSQPLQDPFRQRHELTTYNAPFSWHTAARTRANEPLLTSTSGRDGFETFVIGSVGGHDPVAVQLTEDLARYLHNNQMIMGGIRATVLKTLNPDGLKRRQHENADGRYLNNLFPRTGQNPSLADLKQMPTEVKFVISEITTRRPQRVVHIRTIRGDRGMLAVSQGAMDSGREVAMWLDFDVKDLPADAGRGTLESWAAQRGDCDVITIGIPRQTKPADAWSLYGDAILSLLMDGNSESRRVAREQQRRRAATRQTQWDDAPERSFEEMFREDTSQDFDSASADDTSELE